MEKQKMKLWKRILLILVALIILIVIAFISYNKVYTYIDMEMRFKEFEKKQAIETKGLLSYIEDEKGISKAVPELYVALDKKKQIKSSNSNKEIDLMDLMSEKDDETYELDPKKAEEYGITLPIYKHTFTKSESGNYYWVSTELTNY